MRAVELHRRAVVSLERKEAVLGVQQIANPLASCGVVERPNDEEAASNHLTSGQRETGGDALLVNPELGHPNRNRNSSDLAGGGDTRRAVSHEMKHEAESSLRETCGDSDGQG